MKINITSAIDTEFVRVKVPKKVLDYWENADESIEKPNFAVEYSADVPEYAQVNMENNTLHLCGPARYEFSIYYSDDENNVTKESEELYSEDEEEQYPRNKTCYLELIRERPDAIYTVEIDCDIPEFNEEDLVLCYTDSGNCSILTHVTYKDEQYEVEWQESSPDLEERYIYRRG